MHVLFVPPNSWTNHPNPMRHHFIFNRLANLPGCKIHVLNFEGLGGSRKINNPELVFNENIQLINVRSLSIDNPAVYYALTSKSVWRMIDRALSHLQIDVVVQSNLIPGVIACNLARRAKIPLVYDCIEYYPESASAYFRGPLAKTLAYDVVNTLMKHLVRNSDVVITVSDAHAELVRKAAPNVSVEVVPNGVDFGLFKPSDRRGATAEDGSKLALVYVGSLDEWLDFEAVIEAIHNLRRAGLDLSLTVVGGSHGGYYLERVKDLSKTYSLERHVMFTGFVPYRLIPFFVNAADVALAPYKRIAKNNVTPLKVLEYLASGKIVACTRIPEISRRFEGLVNFYEGAGELTNLLESISSDRSSFEKRASAAREMLAGYSWDLLAEKYHHILRSVAN